MGNRAQISSTQARKSTLPRAAQRPLAFRSIRWPDADSSGRQDANGLGLPRSMASVAAPRDGSWVTAGFVMVRCIAVLLAILVCSAHALAASEEDRRNCATEHTADAKIAACTRVIEDQATPATVRTMAFRDRGVAYANKGLQELAGADFDEAIKIDPNDITALNGRGRANLARGQYDRAIADFTEELRLLPNSDRALNERGTAHLNKGELPLALADFERAIAINADNVAARNNHAVVLGKQGKPDLAIAEYTEALRIAPGYLLCYTNRGRAYEETGQFQLALADYKHALEEQGRKTGDDQRAKVQAKQRFARLSALLAEGKATTRAVALSERRVALVVGNSAYQNVPRLLNPVNDAKAVGNALRSVGFSEVRELYDGDLASFTSALKDFGDLAAAADWAVIYYAGHGVEVGGTNYLIPIDAKLEQQSHVEDEAMPLSRLLSKVSPASKMQLVILDACRNNPFVAKMRSTARSTRSISPGLASIEPDSGVLVAYSARDGTTALDGDGPNSPFALALVEYLTQPGLEIGLLFRKVHDAVYAKTVKQQEPFTYGSLPAQPFYFRP
jgi:tetratricopeptide (TPR) repeat protein